MLVTAPRSTWIQDGSGRPSPCAHRVDRSPSTASSGVFGCEYDDTVTGLPLARAVSAGRGRVAAGLAADWLNSASLATTVKLCAEPGVSPVSRACVPVVCATWLVPSKRV